MNLPSSYRNDKLIKEAIEERNIYRNLTLRQKESLLNLENNLERSERENSNLKKKLPTLEDRVKAYKFKYSASKKDLTEKEKEYEDFKNSNNEFERSFKHPKSFMDKKIHTEEKKIRSLKLDVE